MIFKREAKALIDSQIFIHSLHLITLNIPPLGVEKIFYNQTKQLIILTCPCRAYIRKLFVSRILLSCWRGSEKFL